MSRAPRRTPKRRLDVEYQALLAEEGGNATVKRSTAVDIDEYVKAFPPTTAAVLERVRSIIRDEAPAATETISYAIPTFDLGGMHLVHFAGYDRHVGLYPTPSGMAAFDDELQRFQRGKGSVRLPLDEELPEDLIRRIVRFRVEQVLGSKKPARAGGSTAHTGHASQNTVPPQRVVVENVNHPGRTHQVDAAMHAAMRSALLDILPEHAPGLTQGEMSEAVLPLLPADLYPGGAKAAWWAKTVQLDLEAKGAIDRERTRPLRWHRVTP